MNNVHTDVHAHHGVYLKNKFVKPFGNMKTINVPETVIALEPKFLMIVKLVAMAILHALIFA